MFTSPTSEGHKSEVVKEALATSAEAAALKYNHSASTVRLWVRKHKLHLGEIIKSHVKPKVGVGLKNRVLVIPDIHCPFEHPDTLAFLLAVRTAYNCNMAVCLGDEIDAHAFSRYPMDPNGLTAGKELEAAIEHLLPLYQAFPNMLVCESNHTVRPWKKAFEAGLPAAFLPTYSQILKSPDGWVWRPRHIVDGVLYVHGDNGKSGQYAHVHYMKQAKQPVVIGHIHAFAGVAYEGGHFAMNAGCLIDKEAYCFKYAKGALMDVSLGCGVVLEGKQAHFIPMLTDEAGRYIGRL